MTQKLLARPLTRRNFLRTTAAFALAQSAFAASIRGHAESHGGKRLVYAGTYTKASDGGANGEGIYLFEQDASTGALSSAKLVAKTPNPSWLSIHPSKKYLYAINELADYEGNSGSVTAFRIDAESGSLAPIDTVNSAGAGPAHMGLDATGRFAFVANYVEGTIAVLPIHDDGSLGAAVNVHRDLGSLGASRPASAPAGSFAASGHDHPHAHMIAADPSNRFVLATDLAQDRIYVYAFDSTTGKLTPAATPFISLPSGDGPRHFAFHPNGRWMYLATEEATTLVFFHYDPATGALSAQQTISALPPGFAGTNYASEIAVSPNGKFLLSANRLHDTISVCAIDPNGSLTYVGESSTMGDYPRYFCFDPSGSFLYVCDQRSDVITTFKFDRKTGLPAFTGQYTGLGSPAMLVFLD